MSDLVEGTGLVGKDGKATGEMARWMKKQARDAAAMTKSIAANATALSTFITGGDWGSILYKGETDWAWLAPGTAGQVLKTNGADADPEWAAAAAITLATEQATTSGTAKDFTSIPSSAKRITVLFNEVGLDSSSNILVQLGDSGGFETSGYASTCGSFNSTAGFIVVAGNAAATVSGVMQIVNFSGNTWVAGLSLKWAASGTFTSYAGGGSKSLSGTLTQVRVTVTANSFDAGSVTILYE